SPTLYSASPVERSAMKVVLATIGSVTAGLAFTVGSAVGRVPPPTHRVPPNPPSHTISTSALNTVVVQYCRGCHNDYSRKGNLSLTGYDVATAQDRLDESEKIIRKLRIDIMPPPGQPRPGGDTLQALAEALETTIDHASPANPGTRVFQRLNRPEYEHAVRDLLGLE